MQKYLSFFRIRFTNGLQYRSAALSGILTQFAWGFLTLLMFQAFYRSDPLAFPMELSSLSSYIWLQQALLAMYSSWQLERDIFDTIRSGDIAYELCRPIGLYPMWFTKNMAGRLSKVILRCLPILIAARFLPEPYQLHGPITPIAFLWFLLALLLGFWVLIAFTMLLYIATFYTMTHQGILSMATSITDLLSGAIIPIPFLPNGFRQMVSVLPFAAMQNVPFRIYSGDLSGIGMYSSILLQLFWLIILVTVGQLWIKKALKHVIVQGG